MSIDGGGIRLNPLITWTTVGYLPEGSRCGCVRLVAFRIVAEARPVPGKELIATLSSMTFIRRSLISILGLFSKYVMLFFINLYLNVKIDL